jgi:hypothetical protein
MIFLLLDFGLTEVYVKKPECPTPKGGPNLKGADEWPWRFGSGYAPNLNGFFEAFLNSLAIEDSCANHRTNPRMPNTMR